MTTFIIEVRDSDGNDCSVFDAFVTAADKDAALARLWKHLGEMYPDDEGDGGDGTFHACQCVCPHRKKSVCGRCQDGWECSHGGLLVDRENVTEHETPEAAHAARRTYHSEIDLTEVPA